MGIDGQNDLWRGVTSSTLSAQPLAIQPEENPAV
jgi:hypothetical protein